MIVYDTPTLVLYHNHGETDHLAVALSDDHTSVTTRLTRAELADLAHHIDMWLISTDPQGQLPRLNWNHPDNPDGSGPGY